MECQISDNKAIFLIIKDKSVVMRIFYDKIRLEGDMINISIMLFRLIIKLPNEDSNY